ncbi:hypothetical protein [Nocardioides limicola]|uniref:hypothetical protein n=1 Tax=Nocardioides limicola TaxID=2803368 RepID=UPI00193BE395|nr:hypothetical protein [Nocardioides sp. DJM-14]
MTTLRLDDDEYAVVPEPGRHRAPSGPDPIKVVETTTTQLGRRVQAGLVLLRSTAGLGLRLVGLSRVPIALATAPVAKVIGGVDQEVPAVRLRVDGVDCAPGEVGTRLLAPTDQIVVLIAGEGESDAVWAAGADAAGGSYASRLRSLLDWTPIHLVVDHRRTPTETGLATAALLQRTIDAWPVPPKRIAFIGHGAGGLVIRAAGGLAPTASRHWTDLVTDVVLLGTPHLVDARRRAVTTLGRQFDEHLAGLTTLDRAPVDVPDLPRARYQLVVRKAVVSANPVGGMLGGLLWWRHTATRRPRRAHLLFPAAEMHHVEEPGAALTNHPDVHRALLDWLV